MRFFTQKKALFIFISTLSVLPSLAYAAPCTVSGKDLTENNTACEAVENDLHSINVIGTNAKVTVTDSTIVKAPNSGNGPIKGTVVVGNGAELMAEGSLTVNQVLSSSTGKSAIEIDAGAKIQVDGNLTIEVSSRDTDQNTENAHGLLVKDADSKATINGLASVSAFGNYGKGVVADNNGTITFNNDLEVLGDATDTGVGKFSDGVSAISGGKIKFDDNTLYRTWRGGSDGDALKGDDAAGAFAVNGGTIDFYNINIATLGKTTGVNPDPDPLAPPDANTLYYGAHGLFAKDNGVITVAGEAIITTKGNKADGIRAEDGGEVELTGGETTITTYGEEAYGIRAEDAGEVKLIGGETTITTYGKEAYGIFADSNSTVISNLSDINATTNITTKGDDSGAVYADDSSKIAFNNIVTIETAGKNAIGFHALNGANIILEDTSYTVITTTGVEADAIKVGSGAEVNSNGMLDIRGGADKSSIGIHMAGDGAEFKAANIDAFGNYYTSNTSILNTAGTAIKFGAYKNQSAYLSGANISLAAGSTNALISVNGTGAGPNGDLLELHGLSDFDATKSGKLIDANGLAAGASFTLKANGDPTAASNSITLKGAVVGGAGKDIDFDLTNTTWDILDSSTINDLTVAENTIINIKHANSGVFNTLTVEGDLKPGAGAPPGAVSGIFDMKVDILDAKTDLLKVGGSTSGTYKLGIANDGGVGVTGYEKVTVVEVDSNSNSGADFSLNNTVTLGGYSYELRRDPTNLNNWQLYGTRAWSNPADASGNFLNVGYLLTYIDTQTLMQRMGELRNLHGAATEEEGNMWMRGFAGKTNSFSGQNLHGFDMSYDGYQFGVDKLIPQPGGRFYLGVMGGYTHAKPDYEAGSGTVKDYHGGVYGTYIDDGGFYWDALAKYVYMKNNFSVKDSAGVNVGGTGRTRGYTASFEAGKKYFIKERSVYGRAKFYVEPQAQLSYGMMGNGIVRVSDGLRVKLTSYDSLLGRASIIAGFQAIDRVNPLDVYVKMGYVREFLGQTSYKLNNSKEKHDFGGGWFDMAIGVNAQFKDRHNVYGELSYANGNRFDKQQINFGYRYHF